MTVDEIRSILEQRGVLMKFSLESAIPRLTSEHLVQLTAQCEAFRQAASPEAAASIYDFDHMLSGFSGNMLYSVFLFFQGSHHCSVGTVFSAVRNGRDA